MKKLLKFILPAVMIFAQVSLAAENQALWKEAGDYYDQSKYASAIDDYSKLLERGYVNAEIYYNLANSYFKAGHIGNAIWGYRRALLLNPGFKPARANLDYVRSFNTDQIVLKKRGFILDIWDFLTSLLSSNGYLVLFAIAWWVAALAAVYLMIRMNGFKLPYYVLMAAMLIAIFSATSAVRRIKEDRLTRWGVLSKESVDIREGPGAEFQKIEVGHEGLEFKILGARENSYLIELGNGLKGWVDKQAAMEI